MDKKSLFSIQTLFLYRHAVVSLFATIIFWLFFLMTPISVTWRQELILILFFCYVISIGLSAWRLRVIFKQAADPYLLVSVSIFGILASLFVQTLATQIILFILTLAAILLVTVSPRVAQFSFPFVHKGWRRLYHITWSLVVFVWCSSIYGAHLFFSSLSWIVVVAGLTLVLLLALWRTLLLYVSVSLKEQKLLFLVLGFLFFQISMVSLLLPFGVFSLGLILTWIWYILALLSRFYFTQRGIEWKQQWQFLALNMILFISVILFFLRWT